MVLDTFLTSRLSAERIAPLHYDELFLLYSDPRIMKTLSADGLPFTEEATRGFVRRAVEHWERHGFGAWVFREQGTGRFVGRGGLNRYQIEGRDEIGLLYAVVADRWNRGLATEMASASLRIGFENLGFPNVASWTLPHNMASQRVMEKLGFRHERAIDYAGLPHRLYRLVAADFTSR